MKHNQHSNMNQQTIEAAYLAGYEPSQDGLTGEALYREALEFLTRLI